MTAYVGGRNVPNNSNNTLAGNEESLVVAVSAVETWKTLEAIGTPRIITRGAL